MKLFVGYQLCRTDTFLNRILENREKISEVYFFPGGACPVGVAPQACRTICYEKAAERIGADGIIPSGTAFAYALRLGLPQVHRDTLHAKLGAGRFILALV